MTDEASSGRAYSDDAPPSARAQTLVDTSKRGGTLELVAVSEAATLVRDAMTGRAKTLPRDFGGADSEPRAVDIGPASLETFDPGARYEARRVLGEGGMGEVRLSHDAFVRRDVAMKVIKKSGGSMSDARARFLREARVQGQLEHPAVVPVYDLGITNEGDVYFTMKRIVGFTLEEIIDGQKGGDPELIEKFPRRKIVTAMSHAAMAIAYAHSKGVVHRDLKPANIMLGDFGEVYILDWGVAKIEGAGDIHTGTLSGPNDAIEETQAGALLGTPGYMSPEQARGEASDCDGRADIYALGAVLHEALTLTPLHSGRRVGELLVSAQRVDGARPSVHDTDIPGALDDICHRATRLDKSERFESARELHDAIECFLDGERDRERQSTLADGHTERAEKLIEEEQTNAPGDVEARRAEMMRELGAALALDPGHRRARRALLHILLHEPDTIPAEAEKELDETNRKDRAKSAGTAAGVFLGWVLMSPMLFWMGIRSLSWLAALDASVACLVVYLLWMARTGKAHFQYMRFAIVGNFVVAGLLSVFFGPLVMVPQTAIVMSASFMVGLRANWRTRLLITVSCAGAVALPFLLDVLGVMPSPYSFENGNIVIHPTAVNFTPLPTAIFVLMATAFSLIVPSKLVGRGVEVLISSERRTVARAHRLRQLLPMIESEPMSSKPRSSLGDRLGKLREKAKRRVGAFR